MKMDITGVGCEDVNWRDGSQFCLEEQLLTTEPPDFLINTFRVKHVS
jgi:hypothetical protein